MSELLRVKLKWSGFNGAPGFTVLHFRDFSTGGDNGAAVTAQQAIDAAQRVAAFATEIKILLPAAVRLEVDDTVDVIESTTGDLVSSFPGGGFLPIQGTGAGNYSAAVGAVINWRTAGVRNSRRVRGRSFIVPVVSGEFSTTGGLAPSAQGALQTAAAKLAASTGTPDLMVYARPMEPTPKNPDSPTLAGAAFVVTSAQVPSMGAVLRSRRD